MKDNKQRREVLLPMGWKRFWDSETGRIWKVVGLSTILFSIAAHGFLFTNEMFSHDSVSYFTYATGSASFYLGIGRFLIPVYETIKGAVAAPWLIGLLFMGWLTAASFLTIRLLKIRTTAGQILVSGLFCTNLALTLTGATYIYCLDEYAFALCTAVAAVVCFEKGRGWQLAGIAALAASLAVYQAYFTVAGSLCLLVILLHLVEKTSAKKAFFEGVRYLFLLAISFAAYFAAWTVLCGITGTEKQRVEESLLGGMGDLLALIWNANEEYLRGLFDGTGVLGWFLPIVHGALLLLLLWRLGQIVMEKGREPGNRALLVLLTLLIPTAFHSSAILLAGTETELMTFSGELLYVLVVVALGPVKGLKETAPLMRTAAVILLGCVLWQHMVYANQVYMMKELDQHATLTLASRMVDRVEHVEGYLPGETPVAFVGRLDENTYLNCGREAFSQIQETVGLWDDYAATYNMGRYLTDYLNYPLVWDTETDFSQREEVEKMPVFPAVDSIALVDGTVVVKLS